ncbi:MAG: efflux RND transporter periplasmic adaptor subunit [Pseudomonas sp.]
MRILSLVAATLLLFGCGSDNSADSQTQTIPLKVRSVGLEAANSQQWTLSGTVQSRNEAALGFRLPGQIAERLVQAGQRVSAGEVLLRLDPQDIRQQLASAQANLASARVQAENAEANRKRLESLRVQDLIPVQTYEDARAVASAAAQASKAAEAAVAQARSASGYVELKAPADGVLLEVSGDVGQVVSAGLPVATLAYDGPREVEVFVPERRRAELPEKAQVQHYSSEHQATATLREVAGAADPATRSWRARFSIDDEPEAWSLGSSVTLMLDLPAEENGRTLQRVPVTALVDRGQGMGLWHIREGRVQWHAVELVRMNTEDAFIYTELPADAVVVAMGAHLLEQDQQVEVVQ